MTGGERENGFLVSNAGESCGVVDRCGVFKVGVLRLTSTGEGRDFFIAPERVMRPALLIGLSTRSAGATCCGDCTMSLVDSPANSAIRSLAARLSLLRSRIPLELGSRFSDPDQLVEVDILEGSGRLDDELLTTSEKSTGASGAGSDSAGLRPLIPGGIGDCGNSPSP